MNNLSKNILWAVMTLLIIAFVFSLLYSGQKTPAVLTLDQLATKINSGEVSKIVVSGNDLKIELKDGSKALARKETESALSETLKNYGLQSAALQKVSLEVKEPSGLRFWLGILLPTFIPIIVMVAIFWFIFRQAKGGANQAFSFGRSNLRLFGAFKDKVEKL